MIISKESGNKELSCTYSYVKDNFYKFDKTEWMNALIEANLPENFIENHMGKLIDACGAAFWKILPERQVLSENFIAKYADKIDWHVVSFYQVLSEDFIDRNYDKVDWNSISSGQDLSEKFIEKHIDRVNMTGICFKQKLSESFMEKHAGILDWYGVSCFQDVSKKFIIKHADKIDFESMYSMRLNYFRKGFSERDVLAIGACQANSIMKKDNCSLYEAFNKMGIQGVWAGAFRDACVKEKMHALKLSR